ncbi:glycerate kinase type-2 family protein [Desulforhopalus sp. 52FAK]
MGKGSKDKRRDVVEIFQAGLRAVAPGTAIKKYCRREGDIFWVDGTRYDLNTYHRVLVLGAGKAGASMAGAVEDLLLDKIDEGLIVVKYGHLQPLRKIQTVEAAHPVPDENGREGAMALYNLAERADENTLIICLISGGGSALMPYPVNGVTLADKQKTTELLLRCGADIHEINTVRKHLSRIKGGGLAKAAFPATMICLILSDVVGDDLDSIASGPCVADTTSFSDCVRIFEKYGLEEKVSKNVHDCIERGVQDVTQENWALEKRFFEKISTTIVGCNYGALAVSKNKAMELGYNSLLLSSQLEGETKDVAAFHMALAKEIAENNDPVARPACLISGGETTVTIKGSGKGGRNQEFVLASGVHQKNMDNVLVFSAGTDGTDGPTDAAGAILDKATQEKAHQLDLSLQDYLDTNDSYHYFEAVGDLYKTGPTNTNVMDIRIILID